MLHLFHAFYYYHHSLDGSLALKHQQKITLEIFRRKNFFIHTTLRPIFTFMCLAMTYISTL